MDGKNFRREICSFDECRYLFHRHERKDTLLLSVIHTGCCVAQPGWKPLPASPRYSFLLPSSFSFFLLPSIFLFTAFYVQYLMRHARKYSLPTVIDSHFSGNGARKKGREREIGKFFTFLRDSRGIFPSSSPVNHESKSFCCSFPIDNEESFSVLSSKLKLDRASFLSFSMKKSSSCELKIPIPCLERSNTSSRATFFSPLL